MIDPHHNALARGWPKFLSHKNQDLASREFFSKLSPGAEIRNIKQKHRQNTTKKQKPQQDKKTKVRSRKLIRKSNSQKKKSEDLTSREFSKTCPGAKSRNIKQKHRQNATKNKKPHQDKKNKSLLPKINSQKQLSEKAKTWHQKNFSKTCPGAKSRNVKQKHRQNGTKKQEATTTQEKQKFAPENLFSKATLRKSEDLTSREFFLNIFVREKFNDKPPQPQNQSSSPKILREKKLRRIELWKKRKKKKRGEVSRQACCEERTTFPPST